MNIHIIFKKRKYKIQNLCRICNADDRYNVSSLSVKRVHCSPTFQPFFSLSLSFCNCHFCAAVYALKLINELFICLLAETIYHNAFIFLVKYQLKLNCSLEGRSSALENNFAKNKVSAKAA